MLDEFYSSLDPLPLGDSYFHRKAKHLKVKWESIDMAFYEFPFLLVLPVLVLLAELPLIAVVLFSFELLDIIPWCALGNLE